MAFNPSPKVARARDFANEFDKDMVIIVSISAYQELSVVSFGKTKKFCVKAKKIGDRLFEDLQNNWQYIR